MTRRHGEALRRRRHHVGDAERQQFLVGFDVVVILFGKGLRQEDSVRERQEGDRHGGGRQRRDVAPARFEELDRRQARFDRTDERNALLAKVEQRDASDRDRRNQQSRRHARQPARERDKQTEEKDAQAKGRPIHLRQPFNHGDNEREELFALGLDPEDLAKLRRDQDERSAVQIADEDRTREQIGDGTQLELRSGEQDEAGKHGQFGRQDCDACRIVAGQRQDGRAGEQADRRVRPGDDVA